MYGGGAPATTLVGIRGGPVGADGVKGWQMEASVELPSAERDDSALRIVGGDANGDAVAGDDFDAESPHPSAQLRQNFVAGVHLNAVEAATVHGHNRALHVD